EIGGLQPEPESEHAVAGSGGAAALDVAEHRGAGLHARAALDGPCDRVADVAVLDADVADVVDLALVRVARPVGALTRDADGAVLPTGAAAVDGGGDRVVVDRLLGDQDVVGAAGDAAHQRDPAGMAAHRLYDDDPVVRLGRRVAAVDRLGGDVDGGVEA